MDKSAPLQLVQIKDRPITLVKRSTSKSPQIIDEPGALVDGPASLNKCPRSRKATLTPAKAALRCPTSSTSSSSPYIN
jgi:hypothetical protein